MTLPGDSEYEHYLQEIEARLRMGDVREEMRWYVPAHSLATILHMSRPRKRGERYHVALCNPRISLHRRVHYAVGRSTALPMRPCLACFKRRLLGTAEYPR